MKHAYLILAHNGFELLQILVSCLDDPRNDLYVHIDRKVQTLPSLQVAKAGLFMLEDRVDVRWGDVSVVEAEYALFETAVKRGPYQYYHLLSGADLPLKSQDYIHHYFDIHNGKEFIGYNQSNNASEIVRKVQRWHLFPKLFRSKSMAVRIPRALFLKFQEWTGFKRNEGVEFKKGTQWVSITDDLVRYVIDHKEWVLKVFSHSFCSDEIFLQTLCWQSPYRTDVFDTADEGNGCLRAIKWKDGCLIDWSSEDYKYLSGSSALFARKFNTSDLSFLKRIVDASRN